MLQQSHTPLTNGIMSFMEASEDHELAPIGIGSMHEQAQKLAEYGRHGDIYFVHAAEGETVVPMEVLNANPKVKDMLFNQMREMGLDPDEFVVGNELNSINPVTGMPEFFFSSVWRGVKKAASSVWQGVRKAAPYVIPLVLSYFGVPGAAAGSMFGPGSFGAAFLGGGIGSLVGGKSWKESLRNAAIAGGTAAVWSGIGNIGGEGGFTGGVGRSLGMTPTGGFSLYGADPGASYMDIKTDYTGAYPSEMAGPPDNRLNYPSRATRGVYKMPEPARPTALRLPPAPTLPPAQIRTSAAGYSDVASPLPTATRSSSGAHLAGRFDPSPPSRLRPGLTKTAVTGSGPEAWKVQTDRVPIEFGPSGPPTPGKHIAEFDPLQQSAAPRVQKPKTTLLQDIDKGWERLGDYWVRGGKSKATVLGERLDAGKAAVDAAKARNITDPNALGRIFNNAYKEAGPGYLAEYGPTAAAAYGLYKWSESGESDEERRLREIEEKEDEARKKYERDYARYERDPGKYYVDLGLPPATVAAQGGLAEYPRRDLLVEGRGTERSDDIPAMLSDGEFVMNAKSVRGADPSGRGNRYAGANNLYNMMRNFEMRT